MKYVIYFPNGSTVEINDDDKNKLQGATTDLTFMNNEEYEEFLITNEIMVEVFKAHLNKLDNEIIRQLKVSE